MGLSQTVPLFSFVDFNDSFIIMCPQMFIQAFEDVTSEVHKWRCLWSCIWRQALETGAYIKGSDSCSIQTQPLDTVSMLVINLPSMLIPFSSTQVMFQMLIKINKRSHPFKQCFPNVNQPLRDNNSSSKHLVIAYLLLKPMASTTDASTKFLTICPLCKPHIFVHLHQIPSQVLPSLTIFKQKSDTISHKDSSSLLQGKPT